MKSEDFISLPALMDLREPGQRNPYERENIISLDELFFGEAQEQVKTRDEFRNDPRSSSKACRVRLVSSKDSA
jgi:hypothetical protein